MTIDGQKLPAFVAWSRGFTRPPSMWDYAAHQGGANLAIAFSTIFWPEFIEVDGCTLLAARYYPDAFASWQRQMDGDLSAIERVVNHIHLYDLFATDAGAVPRDQLLSLATTLSCTWKCALANQFPDRDGQVIVADDEFDGPTVTVFIER